MSQRDLSNRREFLQGDAARKAVEKFADGFKAELPSISRANSTAANSGSSQSGYLLHFARDAMAVEFQVFQNAGRYADGAAALAALDLLAPLEAQMTVYRESSEVSRLNRSAYEQPQAVESRLFRLFELAQAIARETGGAYDMTSGPLSKVWGFYRRQGRLPADKEIASALERVGYQKLLLNADGLTLQFAVPNMELNLGGIGKGYALDCMAQILREDEERAEDEETHFLLHGGQSSVLAGGSRYGEAAEQWGWTIGLSHPLRPEERLAEFRLVNQALGTSGSGTQFFHHQGKRYGHIIDPRTGHPAEGVLSCTVIASTAAEADALSTAFYVGGIEVAHDYCNAHSQIAALLVTQTPKSGTLQLVPVNLADDAWRKLV